MPMMTGTQYEESLRRLNLVVYVLGKRVESPVDDPVIRPSLNAVKLTYDLAHVGEYQDLMCAVSHLSGERIYRFTHVHQSVDDLVKKSLMGRLLGSLTGCCFQRCVGMDALSALSIVCWDLDRGRGTDYHARFERYLAHVQERDLVCDGAMTDPKGDRSLPPHRQADPDLFLRAVEERADGIVVRGAKAHQTGAVNSHEIIVMPTMAMRPGDEAYAIAFAVPSDTPGITYVLGRQASDTRRLEGDTWDRGNVRFGGHEALAIFDDVFVPWERVFMYREVEFAGRLVEQFASYHRQSYACKVGVGDVLIGATACMAEWNGAAKASHVRDKIVEMCHLNETLFCGAVACAAQGHREPCGVWAVDTLLANVHKQNVTRFPYEIARLAQDVAGGLMVTLPSEADFRSPEVGPYLEKYVRGVAGVPTEHRARMLRLVENLTLGSAAVGYLTESLHGAGSPQAQRIMIGRQVDLEARKKLARRLCGIDDA